MDKRLIRYGNSEVLVIDKPFRRALGLGRNGRVRITCDGRKLVITPIPRSEPDTRAPIISEPVVSPRAIMAKLVETHCLHPDEFAAIHPSGGRMVPWCLRLQDTPDEPTRLVIAKFARVLALVECGIPRGDAVAVVARGGG